ncbi:MAG: carboxyl transferase domain-containing protein, partial [Terriglobales bacterium]
PQAARLQRARELRDRFASPFPAAERGYLDAVIQPRHTRTRLIQALEMLQGKRDTMPRKKHGNIPL